MTGSVDELRADLFKALALPARIPILEILRLGNHTVAELIPNVGLEASHLSHQLAVLRRANLVHAHKAGSTVVYSIADPGVFRPLQGARDILARSLLAHQELLHELDTGPVHEVVLDDAAGLALPGQEVQGDDHSEEDDVREGPVRDSLRERLVLRTRLVLDHPVDGQRPRLSEDPRPPPEQPSSRSYPGGMRLLRRLTKPLGGRVRGSGRVAAADHRPVQQTSANASRGPAACHHGPLGGLLGAEVAAVAAVEEDHGGP